MPDLPSTPPGVALVTGAARRIGRAIALALARDGWDIAVHYGRSREDALEVCAAAGALGRRAVALPCDLAAGDAVGGLIEAAADALGPVTCLVNSASAFEHDDAASFSAVRFAAMAQVNTAAPVLLARSLAAALPPAARGVVINLLDQKLWNPNPDFLSYTLSKAALREATVLLAQALAPRVRVVGVAPGITLASADQSAAGFAQAHTRTPLGRSSTPADVAEACVYLARAAAVTGTTLLVDGGQHLLAAERDVMFLVEPNATGRAAPATPPA